MRIAVTPSFARFWLFPRLKALEGNPADVRVDVIADLNHSDLVGGEVDLAIRYGRGGWHIGSEQRLFEEPLVPVIAQSLRTALPARPRPKELVKWPLLHNGDTSNWQSWMEAHGQLAPIKAADRIFLDYALALDAAANGLGIALWNRGLHKVPNGLVAMDGFAAVGDLAYYLISRRGDTNSPAAIVGTRILRRS
ncbi:MAG TPA: LysR substrate-binding domain-containing protein [Steroidobacter sp.]